MLKRFMVERVVPGTGDLMVTVICRAVCASNQALANIGPAVQWQHSYVAGNARFCVYLAESEAEVQKHAELGWIPCSTASDVLEIITPPTAKNGNRRLADTQT